MDVNLHDEINNYFECLDNKYIDLIYDLKLHGSMLRKYHSFLLDKNNKHYDNYQKQLNTYNRKKFDIFARHIEHYPKFIYTLKNNKQIETTLAQLHFFMWFIKNNVQFNDEYL